MWHVLQRLRKIKLVFLNIEIINHVPSVSLVNSWIVPLLLERLRQTSMLQCLLLIEVLKSEISLGVAKHAVKWLSKERLWLCISYRLWLRSP